MDEAKKRPVKRQRTPGENPVRRHKSQAALWREQEGKDLAMAEELARKKRIDWSDPSQRPNAPVHQYLQDGILHALSAGFRALTEEKPENPLEFLGKFLLKHNEEEYVAQCTQKPAEQR